MGRWVVTIMAVGAFVVMLLAWRSYRPVLDKKNCLLGGGSWVAAERRCEGRR